MTINYTQQGDTFIIVASPEELAKLDDILKHGIIGKNAVSPLVIFVYDNRLAMLIKEVINRINKDDD